MTCCTTLMGSCYSGAKRERLFALQMVATSLSAAVFIALGGFLGQDELAYAVRLVCSGSDFPAADGLEAVGAAGSSTA